METSPLEQIVLDFFLFFMSRDQYYKIVSKKTKFSSIPSNTIFTRSQFEVMHGLIAYFIVLAPQVSVLL